MLGGRRLPWIRLSIVGLLVALDLWSKSAVFAWIEGSPELLTLDAHRHPRYPVAGEWLTVMLSENRGAAWGALSDYPRLLVIGRVVAVSILGWMLVRADKKPLVWALVLVLAGALGNLYDNLFQPSEGHAFGAVRDFIDVYFTAWDYHFPTFNVADSCITCGAVLLLTSGFFGSQAEEEPESGAESEREPSAA